MLGVDISSAMLARANCAESADAQADAGWRRFLPATLGKAFGARGPHFAQADFSALPFAAGAFELLWSNLALHWHSRPDLVFPEWQRVLKVNGLLMFSTLGPDTLRELRGAYREVEASHGVAPRKHVIDFVDMHDLGDMLVESGFEIPVMDQEMLTITYKSPESLLNGRAPLGRVSVRARDRRPCDRRRSLARRGCTAALEARRARRRHDRADLRGDLRTRVESGAANDGGRTRNRATGRHRTRPNEGIGDAVKRTSVMSEICVRKADKKLRQNGRRGLSRLALRLFCRLLVDAWNAPIMRQFVARRSHIWWRSRPANECAVVRDDVRREAAMEASSAIC